MNQTWQALCPGCFADKGEKPLCPHCGYDESTPRSPLALPLRSLLGGQYRIGRVLGKLGGFGVTYLAQDTRLDTLVAIKEYLPRDLAGRDSDRLTVSAHSQEDGELFRFGLEQFLQEARTLARFDHDNIVRVRNVLEEHGTAYLVMNYYRGLTLAEYLAQQGALAEQTALDLLVPVLDGLREVHAKGFLHRDIKPQNIYLARSGNPILLDFGSARQAMGERSRSLSVVLTAGYAPLEQYHRRGQQGPWTDVYSCGAVLYQMLTGEVPPDATERAAYDSFAVPKGVSPAAGRLLRRALAMEPSARFATAREFLDALLAVRGAWTGPERKPVLSAPSRIDPRWRRAAAVAGMGAALAMAGGLAWNQWGAEEAPPASASAPEPPAPAGSAAPPEPPAVPVAQVPPEAPPAAPPQAEDHAAIEPELAEIPAGCFEMGSRDTEAGRAPDEARHPVCVAAFRMGVTEVTFGEYDRFAEATVRALPSDAGWGRDRRPAIHVGADDAAAYAQWLSRRTGKRYRLSTEAEWEYACRSGGSDHKYCGSDDADAVAWHKGLADGKTHAVGLKGANAFGLSDMSGNVWEWTCSAYAERYDGGESRCEAKGKRVLRGGSWFSGAGYVRAALRRPAEAGDAGE